MAQCLVPADEDGVTVAVEPTKPVTVCWPSATPRLVRVAASGGPARFSLRGAAAPGGVDVVVVADGDAAVADTRFEATPIAVRVAADHAVTVAVTGLLDPSTGVSATYGATTGSAAPPTTPAAMARMTRTAAVSLSGHRVVTPGSTGLIYADAATAEHAAAPLWITAGAAQAGAVVDVVAAGPMVEPSWSWTPGPVWLGLSGTLTQVVPSRPAALFSAQVGYAVSAAELVVDRSLSVRLAP